MFKFISLLLLLGVNFEENLTATVHGSNENILSVLHNPIPPLPNIASKWEQHIKDFVDLVEVDQVIEVVFSYKTDPEVLDFVTFIFSDEFKKGILDFESLDEFKEAFKFLSDKGYEMDSIIDFINSALELPPFEKPKTKFPKTGKGMMGLMEDLIAVLPVKEFKKLFESKLESSPEVAELFETTNSPEFMDIIKRMSQNPKFEEFKKTFEKYGFDFKYLCKMAKEILGEYYQGIFCG